MAQMTRAIVAIGNQSNTKANGGPDPNRVSQWSRVLLAEILSFFVPTPTIDNDPLLLNL